jgi:HlyD family secretion protein
MDIARPSNVRQKRIKRAAYILVGLTAVGLITLGLSKLKPAAPTVEMAVVWPDTVRRGPMVRQVRGLGTLVPEDIRWIPAQTQGRVERIILRPSAGTMVRADSVILELSNPQVEQAAQDAVLQLKAEEANLSSLRVTLQNDLLAQKASAATVDSDYAQAKMQYEMNEELAKDKLVPDIVLRQSKVKADELNTRRQIEETRLKQTEDTVQIRLSAQQSKVDQARALATLRHNELEALHVRAGFAGVLQLVPVDVGAQVAPGTNLARVADPSKLKAELKIAETQAKDIQIGQPAEIDTRNGVVMGKVSRIDPSVQNGTVTVDASIDGALPKGARPDLSVDGTIELERLEDVLFMGRPAFGQEQSVVGLFKIDADGSYAMRTQVKLGRNSVNTVEVLSGLKVGDRVILSDMSQFDAFDRIRLK